MSVLRSFTRQGWVATTRRIVRSGFLLVAVVLIAGAARADEPSRVLDLPGFTFNKLPAPVQRELATVFTDEFDYCGRPVTIAASLKKGDACKHTRRLAAVAARLANEGASANEIILALGKYNGSFATKRHPFKLDERLCHGPADAKVTLVEFADFECPYCAAARPMVEELLKARTSVRACYMPFPLSAHPNAIPAGQAALFARDNGKFWPMHDALFENQVSLSEGTIKELAKKLGLDPVALGKAMTAGKYVDELNAYKEQGKNAGIESTPTIFLNGRKLSLTINVESLITAVDDELDWAAGNGTWPAN